jgi:hypothetical protein
MNSFRSAASLGWRISLGITILLLAKPAELRAEVSVRTSDGNVLVGAVDVRTDNDQLWIRHEEDRIVLTTAVAWSSINSVSIDGQEVPLDVFIEDSASMATNGPDAFLAWSDEHEEDLAGGFADKWNGGWHSAPALPPQHEVSHVEIDAALVNRDRDVEPDGLELHVAAIDCNGLPLPVKGSLTARLWGERVGVNESHTRFEDFQRWSQPVAECDFRDGIAHYYLSFRTLRPGFDFSLASLAQLNVRLSVHGEGNFEASVPVHLRRFNPLADRLQLFEGRRFFRDELTEEVTW